GCRKCERVLVLAVQRFRPEIVERNHRMRDVVLIGPGDGRPRFDLQLLGPEREISDLDGGVFGPGRRRGQKENGRGAGNNTVGKRLDHVCTQPCSGVSMMARRCSFCLKVTLAMPSMPRSLSSGTFIGPGDGADPGAGCGNAVERAVWNVTLPSTFCMTWWMWPLSTVIEPNFLR